MMSSTNFLSRVKVLKTSSEIIRKWGFNLYDKNAVGEQLTGSSLTYREIVQFANLRNMKEIKKEDAETIYRQHERVIDSFLTCSRKAEDGQIERLLYAFMTIGDSKEVESFGQRMVPFMTANQGIRTKILVTGPRKSSSRTEIMKLFELNNASTLQFFHIPHEDMLSDLTKHKFNYLELKKVSTEERKSLQSEIDNLTPLYSDGSDVKQAGLVSGDIVKAVSVLPVEPTTIRGGMFMTESINVLRVV